jgi:hypothetical protein
LPSRALVAAVTAGLAAAVIAAVLTPPGHAVFERVRRAVGVEHASSRLFSLPAPGRLLVVSRGGGGTWIVEADGARRRIGAWNDAEWSPNGFFVVAESARGLTTLDPRGDVRWTLPRREVRWAAWEGTRTDTRIAYVNRTGLRIVAGDGTDDRLLARGATVEPPAWDPLRLHTVSYVAGSEVLLREVDGGRILWRAPLVTRGPLVWADDGNRLAVVGAHRLAVLSGTGQQLRVIPIAGRATGAAFKPRTHLLAVVMASGGQSSVELLDVDHPAGKPRLLFAGPGRFGDVAWSPNGRWLLVDWPTANQWVFLHGGRVHAIANVAEQFPRPDDAEPSFSLSGRWCC